MKGGEDMRKSNLFGILILILVMALPVLAGDGKGGTSYFRSEAFVQLCLGVLAAVLYQVRQHVDAKKKRVIDMAVGIANGVEKGIPDDTDSAGASKIDKALRRFNRDWVRMHKTKPALWLVALARGAIEAWVANQNVGRIRK